MNRRGFTIVELLIVVVVIAILAAITVVAYTGITDQTRDSIVKQDIAKIAKTVELYRVENNGALPRGNMYIALLTSRGFSFDHEAYGLVLNNANDYNILYCSPADTANTFGVIATSSSDKTYYMRAGGAVTEYTGSKMTGSDATCAAIGTPIPNTLDTSRIFMLDNNTWRL